MEESLFRRLRKKTGIRVHSHLLRHTDAVKLLNGTADIITVQVLLAHASHEMTMRYAKLLDNTKIKVFEKVVKQGVFTFNSVAEEAGVAKATLYNNTGIRKRIGLLR